MRLNEALANGHPRANLSALIIGKAGDQKPISISVSNVHEAKSRQKENRLKCGRLGVLIFVSKEILVSMDFTYKVFLFLSIGMIFFADPQGMCGEVPSPEPTYTEAQGLGPDTGSETNIGVWLVSVFRDHISAVDGSTCPSLPTCSSYSVAAFKKHGFFMGWVMMADRLVHEIDEWSVSPVVMVDGQPKIIDPVENNDFWWFQPDEKNEE